MIDALSPGKKLELVRFPPENYIFDESAIYKGDDDDTYLSDANIIKALYPPLSQWKNKSCVLSWYVFGEKTNWAPTDVSTTKHDYFLAFLYANQELDYDHGGLDELNEEWLSIDR
jgi:hypothetical protein